MKVKGLSLGLGLPSDEGFGESAVLWDSGNALRVRVGMLLTGLLLLLAVFLCVLTFFHLLQGRVELSLGQRRWRPFSLSS